MWGHVGGLGDLLQACSRPAVGLQGGRWPAVGLQQLAEHTRVLSCRPAGGLVAYKRPAGGLQEASRRPTGGLEAYKCPGLGLPSQ